MVIGNRMLALTCFFGFQCALGMETDAQREYNLILIKAADILKLNDEEEVNGWLSQYASLRSARNKRIDLPAFEVSKKIIIEVISDNFYQNSGTLRVFLKQRPKLVRVETLNDAISRGIMDYYNYMMTLKPEEEVRILHASLDKLRPWLALLIYENSIKTELTSNKGRQSIK
jgi:hypothetical protein